MKRSFRTASLLQVLGFQLLARIHLNDADIDAAQEHHVPQVLERSAPDDRKHPQVIAIENVGEIGRDANIGAVRPARDDTDRAGIDARRIRQGRRLLRRGRDGAGKKREGDDDRPPHSRACSRWIVQLFDAAGNGPRHIVLPEQLQIFHLKLGLISAVAYTH